MNSAEIINSQPHQIIRRGDVTFTLLGTAHVSKTSADVVRDLIHTGAYDAVAVELDDLRHQAITQTNKYHNMDLISIIRNKQTTLVATNLAMSAYQKRLADQLGIEPGAEMKQAIADAAAHDLPVWNIDRSVSTTMKRTWRGLSFTEKLNLIFGFGGFFDSDEISAEEIEKLKTGDMLESTFSELSEQSASIYHTLIDERDQYMAARLIEHTQDSSHKNVLVIIGAGHLKGLSQYLQEDINAADKRAELDTVPPKSKWPKLIPWLITAVILAGFVWGFASEKSLGFDLIKTWVIYNGVLSALGAIIAGAHPLTIVTAFIAAPITSLNPTIGAGMVTGLVETWLRKPKVRDFESLQQDYTSVKGWWRNHVTRIILIFFFTNLGSTLGTWISGFKIFNQLI